MYNDKKYMNNSTRKWQVAAGVLFVALCGITLHAYWYWDHAAVHVPNEQKKYPLIDPARHIVPKEHFISTIQPLREDLQALVAKQEHLRIALYVEFLNTGANIHINPNERFWPASLTKVPIAMAVMGAVERGRWSLDDELILAEEDRIAESSSLDTYPVGTSFTIEKLLEAMLSKSDNSAYHLLLRSVPQSELSGVRDGLGLEDLFSPEGKVNSKEYARVLRALYTASYLNREHSEYLLELLDDSSFDDFLQSGVPASVPFPHKFGLFPEEHTYNDAGIVYVANRPYLITVLIQTDGTDAGQTNVPTFMNEVSERAYTFFVNASAVSNDSFLDDLSVENELGATNARP